MGGEWISGPFLSWKEIKIVQIIFQKNVRSPINLYTKNVKFSLQRQLTTKSNKHDLPPSNPPGCKKSLYFESGKVAQNGQRWSDHSGPEHARSS